MEVDKRQIILNENISEEERNGRWESDWDDVDKGCFECNEPWLAILNENIPEVECNCRCKSDRDDVDESDSEDSDSSDQLVERLGVVFVRERRIAFRNWNRNWNRN